MPRGTLSDRFVPSPSNLTFSAAFSGLASAASATDIVTLSGSASKLVRPQFIVLSGLATAAAFALVDFIKRSVADSGGGTPGTPACVPWGPSAVAATAVVTTYTANPTIDGTNAFGTIGTLRVPLLTAAAVPFDPSVIIDFRGPHHAPIVLDGVAQQLAINLKATTYAGGTFAGMIVWTES